MRFYLDALLGLTPIRAHRAEQAVRAEHEGLLTHWATAANEAFWMHLGGLGVGMIAGTMFALWTIGRHIDEGGDATTLLVVYWSLKLPVLAQSLAMVVRAVPGLHNTLLRLFEVLDASEEAGPAALAGAVTAPAATGGVRVEMRGVAVVAGGQQLLADIDLDLAPGEHVAIVGPSGSGKTSLVGLLLGWHHPAAGTITVDGAPLEADALQRLRCATAWVDPGVQIWNRSLTRNLRYGNDEADDAAVRATIGAADLEEVVDRLPLGAETPLGEGGGLVSGGEGQRVRLARALLKQDARLAILDEPFRGLDGDKRRELLAAARMRWQGTTMVYVSHDIDTALGFTRVLVIEDGRIVEDGAPTELMAAPDSRLAALYAAQEALRREVWGDPVWRRWRMERGVLRVPGEEGG
jgi:ABC-type multidrug transport system fused ATPase/permease subunit